MKYNLCFIALIVSIMFLRLEGRNFNIIQGKQVAISLGQDCEIAQQLRKWNIRNEAFPFDWNQTFDFEGLLKIIDEDFNFFLDAQYFVHSNTYIKNTYYNINFIHDFPNVDTTHFLPDSEVSTVNTIVPNYIDYLPQVIKKYMRRIERFREALVSANKIYFIRTYATPDQAKRLVHILEKKYSKLNFVLIIAHNFAQYNYDWRINKVKSFYLTQPMFYDKTGVHHLMHNWWSDYEWQRVFLVSGLI